MAEGGKPKESYYEWSEKKDWEKAKPLTEEQYNNLCLTGYDNVRGEELRTIMYVMYHLEMPADDIRYIIRLYLLTNVIGNPRELA